jgi:hypothetical protein
MRFVLCPPRRGYPRVVGHLHTFPAAGSPADIFVAAAGNTTRRSVEASPHSPWATAAAEDACGVVQLEGASVGAAFVGATAAAFGLAEVLRALAGGPAIAIASLTLAAPQHAEFVLGNATATGNPGFQACAKVNRTDFRSRTPS